MQRIKQHIYLVYSRAPRILKAISFLMILMVSNQLSAQATINKAAKKYYQKAVLILDKKDFSNGNLDVSIENLNKASEIDPTYAEINFYFGMAYYYKKEFQKSDSFFLKYRSQSKNVNPDYYLFEGIVKYKLTDNNSAQEHLQGFLNTFASDKDKYKDSLARRHIQLAKQSQTLMSKILPSKKEPISAINTEMYDEYYPILSSDRKRILFNRIETDTTTGKPINKIYVYYIEGDTNGPNPRLLPLNNIENKEFIVTSMNNTGKKILLVSKDKDGLYDIYESEWMIREWTAPRKMYSQINSYADDKFAIYGHNDSLIYVISNRSGGYGGYDIWKINNTPRIIYESIINLGPVINTEYNENYISTVPNSNLIFFATEGHLNIGESDIFRTRLEYGQYTRPVNLGYPINTTADENTFFPYPTANMGLSSQKNATWDIVITYLPPKAKKPAYILQEQYLEDAHLGKTTIITPKDE
jgi:hypothetical protein